MNVLALFFLCDLCVLILWLDYLRNILKYLKKVLLEVCKCNIDYYSALKFNYFRIIQISLSKNKNGSLVISSWRMNNTLAKCVYLNNCSQMILLVIVNLPKIRMKQNLIVTHIFYFSRCLLSIGNIAWLNQIWLPLII